MVMIGNRADCRFEIVPISANAALGFGVGCIFHGLYCSLVVISILTCAAQQRHFEIGLLRRVSFLFRFIGGRGTGSFCCVTVICFI
jgi:hypothetical protein